MYWLLPWLLGACGNDVKIAQADNDGDGYTAAVDCDDAHATIFPDAAEVCDGVDNNCDDVVDTDANDQTTWYADDDGDGYGAGDGTVACEAPEGAVSNTDDCDDADPDISPVAVEHCDGADEDCDGISDEDAVDPATWFADADGDGYGDADTPTVACDAPAGTTDDATDCDDESVEVNPGETEVCNGTDDDCDGAVDDADDDLDLASASTWYEDGDSDGFGGPNSHTSCVAPDGFGLDNSDCDDADPTTNPDVVEECNGWDDDCDGAVDDADASVDPDTQSPWYADADGDGFGDAATMALGCVAPAGYLGDSTDCDDADARSNPAGTEVCGSADEDCDGYVDDDDPSLADGSTWHLDFDGDGHGGSSFSITACSQPASYVATDDDCDDTDAAILPGGNEVCNGVDDDCDTLVDDDDGGLDAGTESTWYADVDADGFGDASVTAQACDAPVGYGSDATDCDDADSAVHPGAIEVCGGVDEDCDGLVDDDDPSVSGTSTWYLDFDSDGYAGTRFSLTACEAPSGFYATADDCDDADGDVHPGGTEVCNGADDDCDGLVDDDDPSVDTSTRDTFYVDGDADGYGDASITTSACEAGTGYADNDDDCDDAAATVYPGATEVCNDLDDDCDGDYDEGCDVCVTLSDGGIDYVFCSESVNGDDALAACTALGLDLVKVDDATKADWLRDSAQSLGWPLYSETLFWIGCNDRDVENTFVWPDGTSCDRDDAVYSDWYSGEPNDGNSSTSEDCTYMIEGGGWNDYACDATHYSQWAPYICE